MTTGNKILAGLLVLQVAVLVAVFWPRSSDADGGKLFPGLEAVNVTAVTISDSEGRSIRLSRTPFGCVLPEADDYPCEENRLPDFLTRVEDITKTSLVAETRASHARLKVAEDDFERLIELDTAKGERHRLYLGTSPRTGSGHVRADGQDRVYLAPGLSAATSPVDAGFWVDPGYVNLNADDVVSFTQDNPQGMFRLEKNDEQGWVVTGAEEDRALDQEKVTSLVGKLASLRLLRPLGKEELETYGLGSPVSKVTIGARAGDGNGEETVIRIGAKFEGEAAFVVKSSKSPYYVLAAEAVVADFIEQGLEYLLASEDSAKAESST